MWRTLTPSVACWTLNRMSERPVRRRGVAHAYPTEKLLAFQAVPAADKLRWLEEMRRFLDRLLTPERKAVLDRFRRGEL